MNERYEVRAAAVVHEVFDDEVVIVNLDSGDYYSVSDAGVDLWNCLLAGYSVGETVAALESMYDGEREAIESGVCSLIAEMAAAQLIVAGDAARPFQSPVEKPVDAARTPFVAPVLNGYSDMRDLLLIDPIHEVDETGWPRVKKEPDEPTAG